MFKIDDEIVFAYPEENESQSDVGYLTIGKVYKVLKIDPSINHICIYNNQGTLWWMNDNCFIPFIPKDFEVGDMIKRIEGENKGMLPGDMGTITEVFLSESGMGMVKLKEYNGNHLTSRLRIIQKGNIKRPAYSHMPAWF